MAEKLEIPFAQQEGRSAAEQNSRETLINMFLEPEPAGRRKAIRRQRKCLELVLAQTGEKRAIEKNGGVHYLVIGSKFYTFDGTTLTERGTLDGDTGYCTIVFDDNGEVGISDGEILYHWNGTTFAQPVTQSIVGTLTFLAGFAVYNEPDTGRFWWSAVNDMQNWDALDFATGEGKPDNLIRVFESYKQLWLFGTETTEIWSLSGGTDSPFTPYTVMPRGCGAALSVVAEDNSLMWLGEDWIFYRADGYRAVPISNPAIATLMAELTDAQKATGRAFTYTDGFHKFPTWIFAEALSVQYNPATLMWNVARTFGRDDWDVAGSQATNSDYVLTGAGISRLVRGINKDNGETVERGGISAPVSMQDSRVNINTFILDCEVGRADIGIDPQIMLRVARDGETFGNERWKSAGLQGDYKHRVVWRGLGTGRKMALMVMATDDFEFSILGGDVVGSILRG